MQEIASFAGHRIWREGPLILFDQGSPFTLEHAERATELYSQIIGEEGIVLILLDFHRAGSIDPETRKHLAYWGKTNSGCVCIAAVGGSFMVRTTLTLVVTAVKLLSGNQPEVGFFATREQATAWLHSQVPHLIPVKRVKRRSTLS